MQELIAPDADMVLPHGQDQSWWSSSSRAGWRQPIHHRSTPRWFILAPACSACLASTQQTKFRSPTWRLPEQNHP